MKKLIKTAIKVLQNYDYLHLYSITQLVKNEGGFENDVKNAEDIINNIILEDIKTNGINSTFIKVGLENFALRKQNEEENLLSFLKCRLKTFPFWEMNKHDINYSIHLFGCDIFSEEDKLLNMLENLKIKGKINSYNPITQGQIIVGGIS
ncbi:hypothetical protein EOM39_03845 [Candidatus Gracilibacteria bacterium]|nr:hypothetical protein [Candidatus Gracilibacteria bacterium]